MEYNVIVRHLRMGRRKISKITPFVKGQYVGLALAGLATQPQQAARALEKAIKSGIANALFKNRNLNPDTLWVKTVSIEQGPRLKRLLPRARGSADRIVKPTCHINLTLADAMKPEKVRRKKGVGVIRPLDTAQTPANANTVEAKADKE